MVESKHSVFQQLYDLFRQADSIICPYSIAHLAEIAQIPETETRKKHLELVSELSGDFWISQEGQLEHHKPQNHETSGVANEEFMRIMPVDLNSNLLELMKKYFNTGELNRLAERPSDLYDKLSAKITLFFQDPNYDPEAAREKNIQAIRQSHTEAEKLILKTLEDFKNKIENPDFENLFRQFTKATGMVIEEDEKESYKEAIRVFNEPQNKLAYEQQKQKTEKELETLRITTEENIVKAQKADFSKAPTDLSSMLELIRTNLPKSNDKFYLAGQLSLLSFLGFQPDKKEKKKRKKKPYWIELWDTNHFVSALSCDYFITEDESLRERSKIVTQWNNLELVVFDAPEALKGIPFSA